MPIDMTSLTREIKSFGLKLGFSHAGIAPPRLSIWADRFRYWIEQGFEGEMYYMSRDPERRIDPLSAFPEAKSIIVVSMNYFPGDLHKGCLNNPAAGYIANYALNEDYHSIVESRLRELLAYINRISDRSVEGRIYVDTGPMPEKTLAVMAGIGWMGKNTLILGSKTGSWLVLGVLLLDVGLDFDEPAADQCGECTMCIEACPTGAIVSPYMLDARRCISYLLGELKGPIPVEMRPSIGNRIFGCDDCQWACPWNRGSRTAVVSTEAAFMPKEWMMAHELIGLMDVDEEGFNRMFNRSPIRRLKRSRFLRNVAVALGNSGDRRAIPVLEKRLKDPDPIVREHVDWALGCL